jgi:hypothetical protein
MECKGDIGWNRQHHQGKPADKVAVEIGWSLLKSGSGNGIGEMWWRAAIRK